MKITALLVLKSPGDSSSSSGGGEQQAVVLANASDVSHFGYFQRPAAREFIVFVARTVALRTPAGRRQSVQHEGTSTSLPLPLSLSKPYRSLIRPRFLTLQSTRCIATTRMASAPSPSPTTITPSEAPSPSSTWYSTTYLLFSRPTISLNLLILNCHVCTDLHP
jgi:hypothetical protein